MRRSARGDQSAFSLFPFLAVLLCTMGSLVVLLVATAHVSRGKAKQEAEAAQAAAEAARLAADSPERRELEKRLADADAALEKLRKLKAEGEQHLQTEQQRLSDIEDHLRRLQDETEELTAETAELIAVENEHYDDAKVAEQELERLNQLIGEIQEEIDQLKHAAAGRQRSFAVVPLRDARTGTLRPPVYLECTESGIVLQPEGVELGWQDLVAIDFSSPVNAAARAVSRYYEEHPETRAANESGKPYPLLIVRPNGVYSYYQTRMALEAANIDYGYQPVAEDWPLDYGDLNPVLAAQVEDAVRTARAEREGLAKVIPKLGAALASAETEARTAIALTSSQATTPSYSGAGFSGGGTSGGIRVRPADPDANNPFEGLRIEGSLPNEVGSGSGSPALAAGPQAMPGGSPQLGAAESQAAPTDAQAGGTAPTGPAGVAVMSIASSAESSAEDGQTQGQRYGSASTAAQTAQNAGQSAEAGQPVAASEQASNETTGQVSATVSPYNNTGSKPGGAGAKQASAKDGVPMVRPIRLYVANDRVVMLPDTAQSPGDMARASSTSQAVAFEGPTSGRINDVLAMLKRHADSWGIAGDGMYWDPRLILNVASDGAQRADDVRRLLEAAGIKVQAYPVTTAANPEGGADASRR